MSGWEYMVFSFLNFSTKRLSSKLHSFSVAMQSWVAEVPYLDMNPMMLLDRIVDIIGLNTVCVIGLLLPTKLATSPSQQQRITT